MLSLSKDERYSNCPLKIRGIRFVCYRWCIATIQNGFKLWHQNGRKLKTLKLPNTVRNVNKKWGVSNGLVLSNQDTYAVAGIRYDYNLYSYVLYLRSHRFTNQH